MEDRRLAAIMFTDIVGYTKLMGDDEEHGFAILEKCRTIQKPIVEKFNGRWLKEIGDGVLSCFNNVTDAVLCSIKIQESWNNETELKLRIGIHLGEVVFRNDDVYGDGVNIASRIEEIAPPGGIYISEAVYRNIQNKKEIEADYVSEEKLKNVKFPVKIYALKDSRSYTNPEKILEKSIAILPFVNMSADPEQEYFCDGISEEVINTVVQYPGLKVSSRTSSFSFKGKNEDMRMIGQKLGVSNVLEGSVRKSGNRVRVTAQLLEASTGFHLWSKKYDRELNDVFAIQDEIALDIADQLMSTLSAKEETPKTRTHTHNLEAYQLYFQGRSLYYQRGPKLKDGLKCFEDAIELDPDYALAYSGLADSYIMLCLWGYISPEECWSRAIPASQKASQLDSDLSETCHTRAIIALLHDRNYKLAEAQFKKAIKLNATNTQPRIWLGLFYNLYFQNDISKGLNQCEIATVNDPLSAYAHSCLSLALMYADRFNEAEKESNVSLSLEPDSIFSHSVRSQILTAKGKYDGAIQEAEICLTLAPVGVQFAVYMIHNYLISGNVKKALDIFEQVKQIFQKSKTHPSYTAIGAALVGDHDLAIKFLKIAVEVRDPNLVISMGVMTKDQTVSKLRGFKEIMEGAGVSINEEWFKHN